MASIFLSHSSHDNEVAADCSRRLKEHGYDSLFLDFDPDSGIKGGRDWERELYRNLKLAGAVIVLCSPHSMASRWCFVEIAQAKALGKPIFPIAISPCQVETILKDRQVIDLTAAPVDEAYRRLFDSLRAAGLDPWDSFHWDSKRPPYPGLNFFDAEDAGIYFGREAEVRQVIETLTRMQRQGEPRLLVVVGSSGSGKSSLVRAGVLPRLDKDASHWVLVEPFRPGNEPIRELARSLFSAFPDGLGRPEWKVIRDCIRDESRAANPGEGPTAQATSVLSEYADDLTMLLGRREASVLLVVDQAEELVQRQSVAGDEASAFLDVLRRATERPGGRVFGLLTLRSDFLGSFQNHPALRGAAFADLPLSLLPVEQFPQAIEGPADRAAITLEPGLVSSMIADARTDDALPLLAFTLREMYERCRAQERLTLEVYHDDLGGIQGAVARVVARIKAEIVWTPEVGRALRRAFLKLVRVNDEGQYTRHPCRWADLPDLATQVLEAFVQARLLSSNGDVVEVTHESLFRVWPELAGWLDQGRELMLWKKNIQNEVKDWIAHDRSPLYLLSGARVGEGRRWMAGNADDFPGSEGKFITASIAAEDDRIARERAQQEKLRWFARILAVAAVTASILGVYAFIERHEANTQRNEANAKAKAALKAEAEAKGLAKVATSRQLAGLSTSELNKRLDRSLLLAVEAFRTANTFEARDSLFRALQDRSQIKALLHVSEGGVRSVAFNPDGRTLAAVYDVGEGGGVVLWDLATQRRLAEDSLRRNKSRAWSIAFSPDGRTLAGGCSGDERGVVLWDAATLKRLRENPLTVKDGIVGNIVYSPDGRTLAAGTLLHGVVLWDVATYKRLTDAPLPMEEGGLLGLAFSPNGNTLAAGYSAVRGRRGGGVVLWDVATRKRPAGVPLAVDEGAVESVAFGPDGRTLAAGYHGVDGRGDVNSGVVLWDAVTFKRLADDPLPVKEGSVESVVFGPDGRTLAAGYRAVGRRNGGVMLWDAATLKRLEDDPLPVNEGGLGGIAIGPDGKTLAAGYGAVGELIGGVVLWDMTTYKPLAQISRHVTEGAPSGVAISPDGKTLAVQHETSVFTGGGTGIGVVLWEVSTHKRLANYPLPFDEGGLGGVAFSPDGRTLAAGRTIGKGGAVLLWDATTFERLAEGPLPVKEGGVHGVAFGPDGRTLAAGYRTAGGRSGGVALWDVATLNRRAVDSLLVKEGVVNSVAFSPDGKTLAAGYGAVGGRDGGVVLWDALTFKRLADDPLPVNEGAVQSVAFGPDGRTLAAGYGAAGGRDGGVVRWDVATHKRLPDAPLRLKAGDACSIAFGPDGRTLAVAKSSFADGGVVLWDVATFKGVVGDLFSLKLGYVSSVAFSPDSRTLAAGFNSPGSGVVFLDVDLESWQRRAGRIANRNFTRTEWHEYFPERLYQATFPELPVPPEETPK